MRYSVFPILVLFVPLCWLEMAIACPKESGATFSSLNGTVIVSPNNKKVSEHPAKLDEIICEGDLVKVLPGSQASLELPGPELLRLNENTVFALKSIQPDKPFKMKVYEGFVNLIKRSLNEIEVELDGIANAMPLGTEFAFSVEKSKASVWVYEGSVKVFNEHGSVVLNPGKFFAEVHKGQAPKIQIDIKPRDAVNWALYYPPIYPFPDASSFIDNDIREAIRNFRQGHADVALALLDSLPPERQSTYFHKVRGAMRLSVGQEKLALQDIHALLASNPNDAEALALQSIRALTQNRKDEAYNLAKKAIAANPKSASAYSALSYAEQGRFELDKALAAAEQAVKLAPQDAMVWARKAELELALGLTSDSEQTAQKALSLDANLERTQTVKGFSNLLRMNTHKALENFNKAIKLDSTSPLARLGLGLAKIRDGYLEQGRQDIEIAANLDPNNSLIRSYLGKAYFEEKRTKLADNQFTLAKQRDPKDPTHYFYNALKKQTENRPVEALQDLQKAIALNDNRAVYRSKQFLDNDLAIRNTSLARIYDDLGFDSRATVEATKSLTTDPSNYSAHRFLSDAYVRLPRREIAQVSELLQSQLMQPLNSNPVQPHLSVKGLSTVSGLGPVEPSFKDFTSAFQRNKPQLTTSGVVGSNDTYGDEAVLSGIYNQFSYSLGQYHFETEGFRKDANVKHNVYNAFLQTALTPDFNLQFEFRKRQTEQGDSRMFLSNEIFVPTENRVLDQTTGRAGLKVSLTTKSQILGSIIYSDRKEILNTLTTSPLAKATSYTSDNRKAVEIESQYLYDGEGFDAVLGVGSYNIGSQKNTKSQKIITDQFLCQQILSQRAPCAVIDTPESAKNEPESYTFYNYNNLAYPKNILWTFGFSYELFKGINGRPDPDFRQRINPKFGVQWFLADWLRFRAVYLGTIKRQLIADQTIEPTQVAGFNQFYDDFNGSQTTYKGIGLDANFRSKAFLGFELTERNINYTNTNNLTNNALESQIHAYFNWTPFPSWSFSIEDKFEHYNLKGGYRLETNQLPLTLKYFDDSGFFAQVATTFVWQKIVNPEEKIENDFSLIGLAIGYRLPNRLGILSLETQNITNKKFIYQDTSDRTSDQFNIVHSFFPTRTIMFRAIINF